MSKCHKMSRLSNMKAIYLTRTMHPAHHPAMPSKPIPRTLQPKQKLKFLSLRSVLVPSSIIRTRSYSSTWDAWEKFRDIVEMWLVAIAAYWALSYCGKILWYRWNVTLRQLAVKACHPRKFSQYRCTVTVCRGMMALSFMIPGPLASFQQTAFYIATQSNSHMHFSLLPQRYNLLWK